MADTKLQNLINALAAYNIFLEAKTSTPTPTPTPTGKFSISNGQIIDPNGKVFIPYGLNVDDWQMGTVSTSAAVTPLLTYFPGTNMLRINCHTYNTPDYYANFIAQTSAKKIVVAFEDHNGISAPPFTGSALTAETNWYAALARAYTNNPYVWFGTFNEPGNGNNLSSITAQEVAIYNAIRNTGNNNPILMELPSGGNPGLVGASAVGYDGKGPMTPSAYASMRNIIWDLHYYGWVSKYSTDPATVKAALFGSVASAQGILATQSIKSADGVVPVIIGEFGNSTTGGAVDVNGTQVLNAVGQSGYGFLAWGWNPDEQGDQAVTDSGVMTEYGKQIAALIATASKTTVPTPTPTPTKNESPSNTIVKPGSGSIVDASGNVYTLDSKMIAIENGKAIPGGSGTGEIAYLNHIVYFQDNATKQWYMWNGLNFVTTSVVPV